MVRKKRRRVSGDLAEYILLILHKEGAQTLQQLEEKTALQTVAFRGRAQRRRAEEDVAKVKRTCERLLVNQLVQLNADTKYELTQGGRAKAAETTNDMERGAQILEKQFLSPSAAARNATVGYVFVATLTMVTGFLSGSVGLIADAADTTVDTVASGIVWVGIKFKKELLGTITILGLMFFTAALLFYESAGSIIENFEGTFVPMSMPLVVIAVEGIALLSMLVISLYQRFIGKRSQSLALISQSIDSKNSMYSSAAVIIGAVTTIFGVYWVDAVVGAFIAIRIARDGIELTREVIKSMRGEKPELSKYKLPFEKQISQRRFDNFRNWILYAVQNEKAQTKAELVASLEKTFRPSYMPAVFNEFTTGREADFERDFPVLAKSLIDDGYLLEVEGKYVLTGKGKTFLKDTIDTMRYKQTEL
jgi:cation diffusion facilitator family transporter